MYTCRDTKKKLVLGRVPLKDKKTQKNDCPIRIQVYTLDKDNPTDWTFLVGTYTRHNHYSVNAIGLPFYRRYERGERFRETLLRYKRNRVLPATTRTMLKDEFIIQAGLLGKAVAALVLRNIYNEFVRFRYDLINSRTPVDAAIKELASNNFFVRYEASDDDDRLRCIFFTYPELIDIYKDNAKVLIYDCTYQVYASSILLLCFDFIIRLGQYILLAYILIEDETFDSYDQAFQQLKAMFKEYKIDNTDLIIYNRNRAAINALTKVFPGSNTMLYTQYIDIVVRANVCKLFGQQKDKYSNRYIASELAEEFIQLYRACRFAPIEEAFNKACTAIDKRAKCGKRNKYQSDDFFTIAETAAFRATKTDAELEEEIDIITRPLQNTKAVTTTIKDTLERQYKA